MAAGSVLTEDDLRTVYKALYVARVKWRPLGIELEIKVSDLDAIAKEYTELDRHFEEMIRKWLKTHPKWHTLIAALKSPTVDEEGVALDIEKVSPENCYVTGRGIRTAEVNEETMIMLHVSGSVGQEYEKPIENISCELVPCLDGSTLNCSVKKGSDNKYEIRYKPTTRGQHQLHVKVEGEHVKGSPFTVVVKIPMGSLGTPIRTISGLNAPGDIAVNERREILVGELEEHCVSIFTPQGEKITTFGSEGSGAGQFSQPAGVAIDRHGSILVVDYKHHRIQKFTEDGQFVQSVGTEGDGQLQFNSPVGIAISEDDKIYVCDQQNHRVQVLNHDLTFHSSFGRNGSDDGEFNEPSNAAFDSRGNVYITDYSNNRIQAFTGDGQFLRKFGSEGRGEGELNGPMGVAIESDDMVFVTEGDGNRVSVFTSEGHFVRTMGSEGTNPGQFMEPDFITFDCHGFLYISDIESKHLQIF